MWKSGIITISCAFLKPHEIIGRLDVLRRQTASARKVVCDLHVWMHDLQNSQIAYMTIFRLAVTVTFDLLTLKSNQFICPQLQYRNYCKWWIRRNCRLRLAKHCVHKLLAYHRTRTDGRPKTECLWRLNSSRLLISIHGAWYLKTRDVLSRWCNKDICNECISQNICTWEMQTLNATVNWKSLVTLATAYTRTVPVNHNHNATKHRSNLAGHYRTQNTPCPNTSYLSWKLR